MRKTLSDVWEKMYQDLKEPQINNERPKRK